MGLRASQQNIRSKKRRPAKMASHQSNDMGGTLVRSIGPVRTKARIGLKNLAYNMRRSVQLVRLTAAAPTGRCAGEESGWSWC